MNLLQVVLMGAGVLAPVTMSIGAANRVAPAGEPASILKARLTLLNGASRLVTLEGVGCTRSICSRTHIEGTAGHQPSTIAFSAIGTIQNTTPKSALFVLQDGARQSMSLIEDFRVLYLLDEAGRSQKVDLAEVKSLQFMPNP
jgi:hypothetical protein